MRSTAGVETYAQNIFNSLVYVLLQSRRDASQHGSNLLRFQFRAPGPTPPVDTELTNSSRPSSSESSPSPEGSMISSEEINPAQFRDSP